MLYYLIDGYNVIKGISQWADLPLEEGRVRLVDFIRINRPQGSRNNKLIIVFDGKKQIYPQKRGSSEISIVFTHDQTADDWIKGWVGQFPHPRQIVVVTNDREIILWTRSFGARIMAVGEFIRIKIRTNGDNLGQEEILEPDKQRITEELKRVWLG